MERKCFACFIVSCFTLQSRTPFLSSLTSQFVKKVSIRIRMITWKGGTLAPLITSFQKYLRETPFKKNFGKTVPEGAKVPGLTPSFFPNYSLLTSVCGEKCSACVPYFTLPTYTPFPCWRMPHVTLHFVFWITMIREAVVSVVSSSSGGNKEGHP